MTISEQPKSKYLYRNQNINTETENQKPKSHPETETNYYGLLLTTIISEGSKIRHSLCLRAAPPIRLPKLKNKKN